MHKATIYFHDNFYLYPLSHLGFTHSQMKTVLVCAIVHYGIFLWAWDKN